MPHFSKSFLTGSLLLFCFCQHLLLAAPIPNLACNFDCHINSDPGYVCGPDKVSLFIDCGPGSNYTYQWSHGLGSDYSAETFISTTTTFTVTVTDDQNCSKVFTLTVPVLPPVTGVIIGDTKVCEGKTVLWRAQATGGVGSFEYRWLPCILTQNLEVSESGTYTLIITDSRNCRVEIEKTLEVLPNPKVSLLVDNNIICQGESSRISAEATEGTAPYQYTWSGLNSKQSEILIHPTKTTKYAMTVTDKEGCTAKNNTTIIVNETPVAEIVSDSVICDNQFTTLNSKISKGVPPYQLTWSNGLKSDVITINKGGVYELIVTDVNLCSTYTTKKITAHQSPSIVLSSNSPICENEKLKLNVVSVNGSPMQKIQWRGPNEFNSGIDNPEIFNTKTFMNGKYIVTATDINGCKTSDTILIKIKENPFPVINGDKFACFGLGGSLEVPVQYDSYLWSTGETNKNIKWNNSQNISVSVSREGCSGKNSVDVKQNDEINIGFDIHDNLISALGSGGTPPYQYLWTSGETTNTIDFRIGTNEVSITDAMGCTSKKSMLISSTDQFFGNINWTVTPNPTNGIITISGFEKITWSRVSDHTGRVVLFQKSSNKLDISELAPAVYLIQIESQGKIYNKRIVKK